jgi:hypothetical protein
MRIKGWDAAYGSDWRAAQSAGARFTQTDVRQVTLAATLGPGTVIWQGATGTNPNKFLPLRFMIPEPSTVFLGALGLGSMLLFRRRGKHG